MDKQSKILIVDDSEMNTKVASLSLKRPDYAISVAHSGKEALDKVFDEDFDLILLDIMMPVMDGYDVCTKLKEVQETRHIPIIFLTARTDVDSIRRAFDCGGSDFISKPFQKAELSARVDTHLRLKQHMEQIETVSNDRKQLLHMMSHDLANPIGASLAIVTMMEDDPGYFEEGKAMLKNALTNGSRIIHLVRKLRALEEPEKLLTLREEKLPEVVDESISMLAHLWKPKKQRIITDIEAALTVSVDRPSFVNSVMNNLLSNAVKFSYPRGEIRIEGRSVDGDMAELIVRDKGIGIPPEMIGDIFSLSVPTGRSGTEGETGSGYGMPLVKRFVQAYGGTVKIESDGEGTTVTCRLKRGSET